MTHQNSQSTYTSYRNIGNASNLPTGKYSIKVNNNESFESTPMASTPSSLCSTPNSHLSPRISAVRQDEHLQHAATLAQAASKLAALRTATPDILPALSIARNKLNHLSKQLKDIQHESKQKHVVAAVQLAESDCIARMALSEAEAYKIAATARGAAITALRSTVDSLLREKSESDEKLSQIQGARSELYSLKAEIQEREFDRRNTDSTLMAIIRQLDHKASEIQASQLTAATALLDARQLTETTSKLKSQLAQAAAAAVAAQKENALLSQRCSQLQYDSDALKVLSVKLEQANDEIDALIKFKRELQIELATRKEEASTMAGELAAACEHNADLSAAASSLQRKLESSNASVISLKQERENLQKSLECLSAENSELRRVNRASAAATQEAATLRGEVAQLKAANALLHSRVERAETGYNQAQTEMNGIRSEAQSLHIQLTEVIKGLSSSPSGQSASLSALLSWPRATAAPSLPPAQQQQQQRQVLVKPVERKRSIQDAQRPQTPLFEGMERAASPAKQPATAVVVGDALQAALDNFRVYSSSDCED
jgi:chromosome segregation ATPase